MRIVIARSRWTVLVAALCLTVGSGCGRGEGTEKTAAAQTPTSFDITNDYPEAGCQLDGPPRSRYFVGQGGVAWSDIGVDGSVDVVRADGLLSFRQVAQAGQPATEWLTVPDVAGDPLNAFASFTSLGAEAPWFFSSGLQPTEIWKGAQESSQAGQVVREPVNPADPDGGQVEMTFGDAGQLERLEYPPTNDTSPDHSRSLTITAVSYDDVEDPRISGATMSLGDLPVREWLLASTVSGRGCAEQPSRPYVECIDRIAGEATVADWLLSREPALAAAPPECREVP